MQDSTIKKEKTVFIYILKERNIDEVRYVGQTIDVKSRYRSHFRKNVHKNEIDNRKAKWIEHSRERGVEIQLIAIEECSRDKANERENYWIQHYLSLGHRLTNGIDINTGKTGGRKPLPKQELKNEHRIYIKDNLHDWLLTYGNGSLSAAIENIARLAGYKEAIDNQKEGTADRRPRRTNQTSSICATELNQVI